jgi:hypothetical protein
MGIFVLTLFVIASCYDSSQTPSLRYWGFGDGGEGVEVFEGVDGVFGGEGGFEISGFGGFAGWGLKTEGSQAPCLSMMISAQIHHAGNDTIGRFGAKACEIIYQAYKTCFYSARTNLAYLLQEGKKCCV